MCMLSFFFCTLCTMSRVANATQIPHAEFRSYQTPNFDPA